MQVGVQYNFPILAKIPVVNTDLVIIFHFDCSDTEKVWCVLQDWKSFVMILC